VVDITQPSEPVSARKTGVQRYVDDVVFRVEPAAMNTSEPDRLPSVQNLVDPEAEALP
jgi:hypothetical protein